MFGPDTSRFLLYRESNFSKQCVVYGEFVVWGEWRFRLGLSRVQSLKFPDRNDAEFIENEQNHNWIYSMENLSNNLRGTVTQLEVVIKMCIEFHRPQNLYRHLTKRPNSEIYTKYWKINDSKIKFLIFILEIAVDHSELFSENIKYSIYPFKFFRIKKFWPTCKKFYDFWLRRYPLNFGKIWEWISMNHQLWKTQTFRFTRDNLSQTTHPKGTLIFLTTPETYILHGKLTFPSNA